MLPMGEVMNFAEQLTTRGTSAGAVGLCVCQITSEEPSCPMYAWPHFLLLEGQLPAAKLAPEIRDSAAQ